MQTTQIETSFQALISRAASFLLQLLERGLCNSVEDFENNDFASKVRYRRLRVNFVCLVDSSDVP